MERRRNYTTGILCLILVCVILLSSPVTALAQSEAALNAIAKKLGCDYEDILLSDKLVPGETVSDWIAVATGCSGNPVKRQAYLKGLEDYVTNAYEAENGLHNIKATEWHRISLAVMALGGDPTDFGPEGINLIADGTYNWKMTDSLGAQGLNGWVFALITLDAKSFPVPENAVFTRELIIESILCAQTDEGGFGLSGGSPDVDITAMTLQALAPYYSDPAVQGPVDRAIGWLSAQQGTNGDFTSWGNGTAEGTAQAVIALCSLGIDPETDSRFVKNGKSAMDGLMQYQTEDGLFRHTMDGQGDIMATEQAALARIAYDRLKQGGSRLYDLTQVPIYTDADDVVLQNENPPKKPENPMAWIVICAAAVGLAGGIFAVIWRGKKKNV